MLSVKHHSVAYGQSTIIDDLNLDIEKNEIVAVVGMTPTKSGEVSLDGTDLTHLKSFQRIRAGIGFVPQGRMIFPTLTVRENIETALAAVGEKKVPEDLYELFPVLKEMQNRRGGNLSGGQQQQLAIARALATRPKVLLLDEPTEGIQPNIIKEIAKTLRKIRDERGLSIVCCQREQQKAERAPIRRMT
jgi:urea transport system ATP-binding protein